MDNNNYTQPNGNEQEGQYTSPQYTAQQMNGTEQNPYGTVPQQDTSAGAMAVVSLILGILSIIFLIYILVIKGSGLTNPFIYYSL